MMSAALRAMTAAGLTLIRYGACRPSPPTRPSRFSHAKPKGSAYAWTRRRSWRDSYDVASARVVGSVGAVIQYLLSFLRVGGDAIAWKGRLHDELAGARKACISIGGEIVRIASTSDLGLGDTLPGRSLVVVRKTRPTPPRFPRSAAEAKR